tara:strand:+ start:812 stop:4477 length:3666 start_codon:yes stop_codon:yes gene_type:complete
MRSVKIALAGGLLCMGPVVWIIPTGATAGGNNGTSCTSSGPDVIVGDIRGTSNYQSVGGIEAFAFGTESCNIGDEELLWNSGTPDKPVIGQHVFRIRNGKLEQLGQGWLKNGFFALSDDLCGCNCIGTDGSMLGVGCSDLYSSGLNGSQNGMSPKYEVNAFTGWYPYPGTDLTASGNGIYKRVQVAISDLDPAQDGGGIYFVEAQYVSPDDAASGNGWNNSSCVQGAVAGSGDSWNIDIDSYDTMRETTAVEAWRNFDSSVYVSDFFIENEGRVLIGSKVVDLGGGVYEYIYAVQNQTSDRSIDSFTVPVDPDGTYYDFDFNDVDYHSGSPVDGTDWSYTISSSGITWQCSQTYQQNVWANAIRWGTAYTFSFRSDVAPQIDASTLGIFKPATGGSNATSATGFAYAPVGEGGGGGDCNGNGSPDGQDIADGSSSDCNGNGLPDECENLGSCSPALVQVKSGLGPLVEADAPPGDTSRLFVMEQTGRIRVLSLTDYSTIGTFLNLAGQISTGGERGLLGLAFDPDYDTNGYFYVNYTNTSGNTVISRYRVSTDPNVADSGSETILKTINQDYSNHNGGCIRFGPDGMLYVGMGDGGSGGDPLNRAQDGGSLLGKMLRLDPDNPPTYVPVDNPFVGDSDVRDEIWSTGLRNPWKFSFDRQTGDMWIGDVGQNAYEEIDFEPAGSGGGYNWGWRCYEGDAAYDTSGCSGSSSYAAPIHDYNHSGGACTVIGGHVYRGCEVPQYQGLYFYAEYCADWIKVFRESDGVAVDFDDLSSELGWSGSNGAITSFAEGQSGELYVLTLSGSIYKLMCIGAAECGNGIVEAGEDCDDGNDAAGDGCFECQIEQATGSASDLCADAPEAIPGENPFDTSDAGAELPDPSDSLCGGTYLDWDGSDDVWFRFTPGLSGTLSLSTCDGSSYDTSMALYEGDDCTSLTLVACNGDATGEGGCQQYYSAIYGFEVVGGSVYWIRLGGWQGATGAGTLTLDYTSTGSDCNGNGIEDFVDIAEGKSTDCNGNDVPDECDIADGTLADCDGGPVGSAAGGLALIQTWCFGCHGPDGGGGKQYPGPSLRDISRVALWDKMRSPTDHPGGAHDEFTEQDFADLEAFLSDGGSRSRPDLVPDICQSLADCNDDGISDACELEAGTQVDLNWDGVPDDCQTAACAGDVSGDGTVDVADLLQIISDWGSTSGPSDCASPSGATPDGSVDVSDLLYVISDWGCTG